MLPRRRAQVWRHQPQYRRPRHFHQEPEFNLVVRGSCMVGMGTHQLTLAAGELVVFAPGQDHVLLGHSTDFDLFVVALTPELAERVLGMRAVLPYGSAAFTVNALARRVEQLELLGTISDAAAVERELGELFACMLSGSPRAHVLSRRAASAIAAEPNLSEADLATRLHTTSSGISRHFRHDLGLTLVEHRARMRLMAFVAAVERGASLTSAAFAAGFGSYAQCHRVFRRLLGQSPRDYFDGGRELVANATASER
ncbi:MAG TPA: helix-turn-helix transcriptional regulator [Polyangiaceae bacterium]|nr:helix-turn-helix transcriptional regulator [Polyangiaceae bacterium]